MKLLDAIDEGNPRDDFLHAVCLVELRAFAFRRHRQFERLRWIGFAAQRNLKNMITSKARANDTSTQRAEPIGTLETIQLLRFVAAALVVVTHVSFYVNSRADSSFPFWPDGSQGVALFFVISGFIMTVTTDQSYTRDGAAWKFTVSRIIRIVPLYWAVNATKLVGLFLVPGLIFANPDLKNVILSLLFLPSRNADGNVEAFYGVGWTLNFEMMFYALFAIAIVFRIRPSFFVIPILILLIAGSALKKDSWPAAAFFLDWRLIFFVWGILIGEWYISGRRLNVLTAVSLIVAGLLMMFAPLGALHFLLFPQLHCAAVVLGFLALEEKIGRKIPRILSFMGDASYSLYLIHPTVGVLSVVVLHRIFDEMSGWLMFVLVSAICTGASAVTYLLFERPVTRVLRNRFMPR